MAIDHVRRQATLAEIDAWESLPAMALESLARGGDAPFLWDKPDRGGEFVSHSFAEIRRDVIALAHGLIGLGLKPGERVVLVSENRPEWLVADIAILLAGGITVPAYVTNTEADHTHVLEDSDAVGVIVTKGQIGACALNAASKRSDIRFLISLDREDSSARGHALGDLLDANRNHTDAPETLAAIKRDDLATLIYTSGTGGAPKGVMLSHRALFANAKSAADLIYELDGVSDLRDEVFLSFLPLSHAYERTAGHFFPLAVGSQVYYAESTEKLAKNLTEAKPTIMTAVPRLYESLHARITQGLKKESDLKQKLFSRAVTLGIKRIETGGLSMMERIEDATLDSLVRAKVRERFGGRLKALVSGGAPLNHDIGLFFSSLGLCLLQGYGQTEAGPVVSCNRPDSINLKTVGPALIDVEIKIADDGEILVRGPLLMEGYWKRADDSAEALQNGWLHTGDVGAFDSENRLMITDRKKDLIVNAGGDNIAPQRVEGILALEEEIEQAMVFGDKRPNLVALIVPGEDFCRTWAADHGVDQAGLLQDAAFRSDVQAAVDRANEKMSRIERVRRWAFADEAFTTDNGLMTATMKIRRKFITAHYLERLEALY